MREEHADNPVLSVDPLLPLVDPPLPSVSLIEQQKFPLCEYRMLLIVKLFFTMTLLEMFSLLLCFHVIQVEQFSSSGTVEVALQMNEMLLLMSVVIYPAGSIVTFVMAPIHII